jgi:hypothetical protein
MHHAIKFAIALTLLPASAFAAPAPERLRGVIETVTPTSITLLTAAGVTDTIVLTDTTRYAVLTKSSLGAILPESYIGTAAKGSGANMVALEVVVFPPSMRGVGDGHYPWDPLPDIANANRPAASSMTNGSVSDVMETPAKIGSSMTNGSVQTVSTLPGAKQISVVYKGGKQIIMVLPGTPVVAVHPAARSALLAGAHAFAVTLHRDEKFSALYIGVGATGVIPPM